MHKKCITDAYRGHAEKRHGPDAHETMYRAVFSTSAPAAAAISVRQPGGQAPAAGRLIRPQRAGATAHAGTAPRTPAIGQGAEQKEEGPHGPPLRMSGEFLMDCEPATLPFMSRKSDAFHVYEDSAALRRLSGMRG